MKSSAGLISVIIEFTACMQGGKDNPAAESPFMCIPTGMPRPLSRTVQEPSASRVTHTLLQ